MFRQFATPAARAALQRTAFTNLRTAPRTVASFHASVRRDEDSAAVTAPVESKGGLFGTGYSEWFALPVGIVAAIPIIKFDLYVINEETQLLAVFVAFCVTFYTQAGEAVWKSLDDQAQAILKEQKDAEDLVISGLERYLSSLKSSEKAVDDLEEINAIRAETYKKLNAAGAIKPKHDFKSQIERMLNMIQLEEANVAEKAKALLMEEATVAVTDQFTSSKNLKKAALDAAIATIKGGGTSGGADPVQEAFVSFFKEKAAAAKKSTDDSEEKAQRAALIAKMNAVAKNEGFFFQFDESGAPKMVV